MLKPYGNHAQYISLDYARSEKHKLKNKRKAWKDGRKNKRCPTSRQDDDCLKNLVTAETYERDQIGNFLNQHKRVLRFMTLVANKAKKKADFSNSTSTLIAALGGNGSNPTCGGTTRRRHFSRR